MRSVDALFARLWDQYASLTPQAQAIRTLLEDRGEAVVNDHVAFRTFDDPRLGIDRIAAPFLALGYEPRDAYRFEEKRLLARYYAHEDPSLPKVFVSELLLEEFSDELQRAVAALIEQTTEAQRDDPMLLTAGRPWSVDAATYEALSAESEYAGWMAAFGYCANHFTVLVNELRTFDQLTDLAAFVEGQGFAMNRSGGLIKGGSDVLLEQCSTMASRVETPFEGGALEIPSCYYEFAKRYEEPGGKLYQGFVAASADRIFESTNR